VSWRSGGGALFKDRLSTVVLLEFLSLILIFFFAGKGGAITSSSSFGENYRDGSEMTRLFLTSDFLSGYSLLDP